MLFIMNYVKSLISLNFQTHYHHYHCLDKFTLTKTCQRSKAMASQIQRLSQQERLDTHLESFKILMLTQSEDCKDLHNKNH